MFDNKRSNTTKYKANAKRSDKRRDMNTKRRVYIKKTEPVGHHNKRSRGLK